VTNRSVILDTCEEPTGLVCVSVYVTSQCSVETDGQIQLILGHAEASLNLYMCYKEIQLSQK